MKHCFFLILITLVACNTQTKKNLLNPLGAIETRDYLEINNQLQEILQKNNGKFPVIVYEKTKGNKQLIYLGEQHGNDPADDRFDTIQKYFTRLNPAIILNEGGQIADSIHYKNKEDAIRKNGTIGFLKFLSDHSKINMQSADCPESVEIEQLLSRYDKDNVLYFLVVQRFIPQFIAGYNGATDLDTAYKKFTENYLVKKCKLRLTEQERQWHYFEQLYQWINNNRKIDLKHYDLAETEYWFHDKGEIGKISRNSMHIRDSVIVTAIYSNLLRYDKVFIVFGGAHIMAQKATLDKLFE